MAKKNKKQKRKQKRNMRVKQERSLRQALPALMRKDPSLRKAKLAMVHVVREAPTGKVLAAFLVDLLEFELKDLRGEDQVAQSDLEELWDEIQRRGSELVPCDYALQRLPLVEGTVNLAPANVEEKDLELFGDHGLPLETGKRNGPIDVTVLQGPLALDGASLPAETLARIGDIKAALVDYSGRHEFR